MTTTNVIVDYIGRDTLIEEDEKIDDVGTNATNDDVFSDVMTLASNNSVQTLFSTSLSFPSFRCKRAYVCNKPLYFYL